MVARSGAGWRLAPSLVTLIDETDRRWPRRSRASDGSIGDVRHQKSKSDHNPHAGFVTAVDITEDPTHGPDLWGLWNHLVKTRDPRVKYMIYEGRIIKSYVDPAGRPAWVAQKYTGSNKHDKHLHISVKPGLPTASLAPWYGEYHVEAPKVTGLKYPGPVELHDSGPAVTMWQRALAARGYDIKVDGQFGEKTNHVVVDWQKKHGLVPDGIAGPRTWHSLIYG